MTPEEHQKRHIELHKALDELFADFIRSHPDLIQFTGLPIKDLMDWSYKQTLKPTEP